VLAALARIESLQEHHDEALELQRTAVAALAEDTGAGDLERAVQLETLAQMEILHGAPEAAGTLLERAVALREEAGVAGADEVLASAASTALGAAEPELAERLAVAARRVAGGQPPPVAADQVLAEVSWMRVQRGSSGFAELLAVSGDAEQLAEADARLEAYLRRLDAEAADTDQERIETLSRLARVAAMRGDLDGAVGWQRQLAAALADGGGDTSLEADDGLAYLLTEAGRFDEALAINSALLARLEEAWGSHDGRLAPVLERQAGLLAELGRRKDAKAIRKRLKEL